MEREQRYNQEEEESEAKRPEGQPQSPEEGNEGKPEAEKTPDNTEMWSVESGLDRKAKEAVNREGKAFHESVSELTFGDPADFAMTLAGTASLEMQPYLEAFQQATKSAPETGKVAKARETIQQTLDQRGEVGTTLDKKG